MATTEVMPVAHDDRHEINVRIGNKIRGHMAERRRTQEDIARLLGHQQQSVSKRLNGHVPFEAAELVIVAEYFGLTLNELVGDLVPKGQGPSGGGMGYTPDTRRYLRPVHGALSTSGRVDVTEPGQLNRAA